MAVTSMASIWPGCSVVRRTVIRSGATAVTLATAAGPSVAAPAVAPPGGPPQPDPRSERMPRAASPAPVLRLDAFIAGGPLPEASRRVVRICSGVDPGAEGRDVPVIAV